jgi:monoamine oxidase
MCTGLLTGWAGGAQAAVLKGQGHGSIISAALAGLSRLFSTPEDQLRRLLVCSRVFDWHSDPFARGAYAYMPVGGLNAPAELAEPVDDTLFFAGEATDMRRMGTVAGALASGYRAAEQVLSKLGTGGVG